MASLFSCGVLVVLSVIVFLACHVTSRLYRFFAIIKRLPQGPKPLPLVGNTLSLTGGFDSLLQVLHVDWPQTYGELFCMYIGPICNVTISSPELMEPILKSNSLLRKGTIYDYFRPLLGDGLLLSYGSKWRTRRRLITPAFHFRILEDFFHVFYQHSLTLCNLVEDACRRQDQKIDINIYPLIANCTLDVICETAMGVSVDAQTHTSEYVQDLYRVLQIIMERFMKPWLAIDLVFYLTKKGKEHQRLLVKLHAFTQSVISKKRQKMTAIRSKDSSEDEFGNLTGYRLGSRRALLDILLEAKTDGRKVGLDDKDIQEEIDTFMFEGHDTTTSTISWFLYCMATYPIYQERVWNELQEVLPPIDSTFSQQDVNSLTYLDCCLKESLRLYSTVPHIERFTDQDFQLGKYLIPAGCNIILSLYAMHHNPRLFENPWVYDPDRFLRKELQERHSFAYIPFSAGPRNCIGQRFALMEVKVVVANFLRRFKVASSSDQPVPSMQSVLKPLDGLHLVITSR